MTIDRWIAVGVCCATFLSALAAYLTARHAGLQRILSYKPHILLKPNYFHYTFDSKKFDILNRIELKEGTNSNIIKDDISVNIGLGAALDVNIHWEYNAQEAIKVLNSYFEKLELPVKLNHYSNGITSENSMIDGSLALFREFHEEKIDYILSYNQNPSHQAIIIPFPYISICCAIYIFSLKADKVINKSFPKMKVRFKYKDIGGTLYDESYIVNLEFHYLQETGEKTIMGAGMSFLKEDSQSITVHVLEKSRKSYDEWLKNLK